MVVLQSNALYFQFVKKLDKLSDTGRSPIEEVRTRFGVRLAKHNRDVLASFTVLKQRIANQSYEG